MSGRIMQSRKWNVDIKMFILTVVENSDIDKFSYLIEFENKKNKKSSEIILLART